jgi:trimeric autotransporter adhesin
MIWTYRRKLLFLTGLAAVSIVMSVGCRGFFVKPTLTKITINPATTSVLVGGTQQLTATGTNDDNSTSDVTTSSSWSSSDSTLVTVSSTGLVTGVANTTTGATITAVKNGISGTATVTVGQQTLTITSPSGTVFSVSGGLPQAGIQLDAKLGNTESTSTTTFTSSDPTIVVMSTVTPGLATFAGGTGTVTITGTNSGSTGTLQITVNP